MDLSEFDTVTDLSQFDTVSAADDGAFMQLQNPYTQALLVDQAGNPIGITFAGSDSERARKFERQTRNRRLKSMSGRRNASLTAEEIEEDGLGLISACAISWHVPLGGETPDCTPANVRAFLKRFPAFREQADAFVGDRSNFLKA